MIRLALAAALAGSALGAAVVLADEPEPARPVPVAVQGTPTPTPTPAPIDARDVRIALEVADPHGEAPWAVQRFTAKFPRSAVERECVGVGRLSGGKLGWIDAQGRFTPYGRGGLDAAGTCLTANQLRRQGTIAQRLTTVALAPDGTAKPKVTVSWGMTDAGVRSVHARGAAPAAVTDRAFLTVERGEGAAGWLTGTARYADGRRTRFNPPPPLRGEQAVPGSERVVARAPDPAGGLPWAVVAARGERGTVCLSHPGRLVGTRLGHLDRERGIFAVSPFDALPTCPRRNREPTRGYPMRITTGVWGAGFDNDPRGRIERRVESTRIIFAGRVHADVATVTIRTPRDVRTLVPSPDGHVILAVYEGRFPGGRVTATARMKDGREVTRSLYVE